MTADPEYKAWGVVLSVVAALLLAVCAVTATGQTAPPSQLEDARSKTPVYDVSTIKPNHTMSGSVSIRSNADMFSRRTCR